ncbi:MAG: chemotaxis protein CheD [Bryobacteraceae bacterium]
MNIVIGVADCQVSREPDAILTTFALGSCIAVAVYDPQALVAGMLHFMLPESAQDPGRAERNPYMFADTGIPLLFHQACHLGAEKRRMIVRVAGGSQLLDERGLFNIGKRNYLAVRKILWKAGVLVRSEEAGGNLTRTLKLHVATGRCVVTTPGVNGGREL